MTVCDNKQDHRKAAVPDEECWRRMLSLCLNDIAAVSSMYAPTSFWSPGVVQLLSELEHHGIESFKSWPSSHFWFYPLYGQGYSDEMIADLWGRVQSDGTSRQYTWFRRQLSGAVDAYRDFDMLYANWDHSVWRLDFEKLGESPVGMPTQTFSPMGANGPTLGKAYLSYLLCLSALSHHLDSAPSRFLEIGGGFGALGEIVLAQDERNFYLNLDIPPLVAVSSYYLQTLFGKDSVLDYQNSRDCELISIDDIAKRLRGGSLPSWEIEKLSGPFDVFCNAYSFQEMEPHVVRNYINKVARLDVKYVVSLNTINGKPMKTDSDSDEIGVVEQVTSDMIITEFESNGYEVCGRYRRPLIISAGELVVLRNRSMTKKVGCGRLSHAIVDRSGQFNGVWPA
ncbi:MAG: putative sugar O-methyltransferase [Gammaproteobacteria bacterium]|nr:putative sugar O-methyltransferase [Gammaproteobacteria bacterium]